MGVGVSRKGSTGGVGVWVKGRGPSRRTACLRLREDVMTVWQFGVKQGLGKDGRVAGLNTKKTMLTDGMKGGELIDLLSAFFSEAPSQTEAPGVYHLQRQCDDEDAPSGGIWKRASKSLRLSTFERRGENGCEEQKSKCLSERHSNLLNDWKIIMHSQLIISRIAADWEYSQKSAFVFAGFLTGCWWSKTHLQGVFVKPESLCCDSVLRSRVRFICICLYLFALDIRIYFDSAHP